MRERETGACTSFRENQSASADRQVERERERERGREREKFTLKLRNFFFKGTLGGI